jgi:hypothetical protein
MWFPHTCAATTFEHLELAPINVKFYLILFHLVVVAQMRLVPVGQGEGSSTSTAIDAALGRHKLILLLVRHMRVDVLAEDLVHLSNMGAVHCRFVEDRVGGASWHKPLGGLEIRLCLHVVDKRSTCGEAANTSPLGHGFGHPCKSFT